MDKSNFSCAPPRLFYTATNPVENQDIIAKYFQALRSLCENPPFERILEASSGEGTISRYNMGFEAALVVLNRNNSLIVVFSMKKIRNKFLTACQKVGAALRHPTQQQAQLMMFGLGICLVLVGTLSQAHAQSEPLFNDDRIEMAFGNVLAFLEGSFGALIMVAAGLGAILSSAFGQYRAALGCLVIAVGTFILRSFISTFFKIDVTIADGVDPTQ